MTTFKPAALNRWIIVFGIFKKACKQQGFDWACIYVNISCSSLISFVNLTAWCLRWLCTSRMWGQLKLVKQVALWLSDHKPTTVLAQGMSRWTLVSNHWVFPNLWEYDIDQESGFVTLWSQIVPRSTNVSLMPDIFSFAGYQFAQIGSNLGIFVSTKPP